METTQSPDKLVLRSKPFIGARLGKRGGLLILGVLLTTVITVVASIESRRQHGEQLAMKTPVPEAADLVGSTDAAKAINDQVGDNVGAVEQAVRDSQEQQKAQQQQQQAAAQAAAAAAAPQQPIPNLSQQTVPAIQAAQAQQKLVQEKQQEEQDARNAGMNAGGGGAGNWQAPVEGAGASAPSTSALSQELATRQAQLNQQLQTLASGAPNAAAMARALGGGAGQPSADDQDKKNAWLDKNSPLSAPLLQATRKPAPSPYYLATGAVLNAVTLERLVTDLPGEMRAMVISPVYDSATGTHLLVPPGTQLFGKYDSSVAFGQERTQVCWQRLVYPDASTLELGCMKGDDQSGAAGFQDQVNNHIGRLVGYGVLTSLMGAAFQLSQPQAQTSSNGTAPQLSSQQIVAGSVGQELSQLGVEVTRRNLNVQPTITIRSGYRFVVKVNQDIVFPGPYEP